MFSPKQTTVFNFFFYSTRCMGVLGFWQTINPETDFEKEIKSKLEEYLKHRQEYIPKLQSFYSSLAFEQKDWLKFGSAGFQEFTTAMAKEDAQIEAVEPNMEVAILGGITSMLMEAADWADKGEKHPYIKDFSSAFTENAAVIPPVLGGLINLLTKFEGQYITPQNAEQAKALCQNIVDVVNK